ncbi:hypothetical protein [Labedaea rhizosphaerae]|uniref:hypothetical protein n=1 Tax=Labedaea rhizosphaerae TaxID=598644 RepID=UPI001415095C|nr:hypothetical protein [Labedaea rhizosphaerae]
MTRLRGVVAVVCAVLLTASCGAVSTAGNQETDRQSQTLADAISYPRQENAAAFARAALATTLGKTPSFSVLEATDLPHTSLSEPMARLVWRIHHDATHSGYGDEPELDACYRVEFDYYGPSSGPTRVTCPAGATPITPPPLPGRDIPSTYAPALKSVLGKLPDRPTEADVRAALTAGLPKPVVNPETGLANVPPQVFVEVRGVDVGVALFARTGVESKDCMMGHRVGGTVAVWSLNQRELTTNGEPVHHSGRVEHRLADRCQVGDPARRQLVPDGQAQGEPQVLELANVHFERCRLPSEGLRQVGCSHARARLDRCQSGPCPRAPGTRGVEPVQAGGDRRDVVGGQVGRLGEHRARIRVGHGVDPHQVDRRRRIAAQVGPGGVGARVACGAGIGLGQRCRVDPLDRGHADHARRRAVDAARAGLALPPPAQQHGDRAVADALLETALDQHAVVPLCS